MSVYETIQNFLKTNNYLQDEHILGVLFYGSYKHGLNNQNSDIDLHIIYDDSNPEHLIRGNTFVNGIRIEYFEKTISEIYNNVEEGYTTQDNATESIIGKAEIIYEKDNSMQDLQEYVLNKFKNGLPPLTENEAKEQVSIINNRMEKLKKYAEEDSYFFEHLYHLTIEKIRRFYHNLNGMPRIETYKGFKLYRNKQYQDMFSIHNIPDQRFLEMYFELIQSQGKSKNEMFERLKEFYDYAKITVDLEEHNYRIPIKSKNDELDIAIDKDINLDDIEIEHIQIPEETLNAVTKFMEEMNYIDDEHFLGVIVYGSSLTGFNTEISDIDLHVIFDNSDPNRMIRGEKLVDGKKIEYFEKPIDDEYLMAENEFLNQNNASLPILGKGEIVFARDNSLINLQKYILHRFQDNLPPLNIDEAREQISIIDNKIKKLENLLNEDSPYFDHLYHIVLEKMRKIHHRIIGISKIPTSKVHRIYTDEPYRKSTYKTNPSQDFVENYLSLVIPENNKKQMLESLKSFYIKVKQNIELGEEYRIPIKSKRKLHTLQSLNRTVSSSAIAKLDKENATTTTDVTEVGKLFSHLRSRETEIRRDKND